MSLIAAFLWNKTANSSISTMIIDDENFEFLSRPKIQYFPNGFFHFRRATKKSIKEFFSQIEVLHKTLDKRIIIEFRIVFTAHDIPYLKPSLQSKFVYKTFFSYLKKMQNKITSLECKPQLRNKLSGRELKIFKKELRALHLVSRKRDTGFEYHLWTVALHATPTTYVAKLRRMKSRLINKVWDDRIIFDLGA
jgi:hypothetical protein